MVRILNGLRYDTDKASFICFVLEEGIDEDWKVYARLYRTKSKRFFLAGFSTENGWGIVPISEGQAYSYARKHVSKENIEYIKKSYFYVEDA